MRMKFGVMVFQEGFTYSQIKKFWTEAERLEFDSVWVYDHLINCLEGWTLISALAPQTQSIRFGLMVACNSYRHPPLLAKMAATLDIISNGRLEFGIGAGDMPSEYIAYGYTCPETAVRIAQLEEALCVIKMLWTEDKPTFKGKYYSIKEAGNEPKPVQKPHPPIWIGSLSGKRLISRVAALHADVYNVRAWNTADYIKKIKTLEENCRKVGRNFEDIVKTIHVDFVIARTKSKIKEKLEDYARYRGIPIDEAEKVCLHGTPDMIAENVKDYVDLGVEAMILCFQPNKRLEDLYLWAEVVDQFK